MNVRVQWAIQLIGGFHVILKWHEGLRPITWTIWIKCTQCDYNNYHSQNANKLLIHHYQTSPFQPSRTRLANHIIFATWLGPSTCGLLQTRTKLLHKMFMTLNLPRWLPIKSPKTTPSPLWEKVVFWGNS
jgi:hypothetical protein